MFFKVDFKYCIKKDKPQWRNKFPLQGCETNICLPCSWIIFAPKYLNRETSEKCFAHTQTFLLCLVDQI